MNAGAVEVVGQTFGGSTTKFRFKLPKAAACAGDSAKDNYRVQSFLVPQSVDLATLRFTSEGPLPVGTEVRQPMVQADGPDTGNPYISVLTAEALAVGGPGPIIQPLPSFSFAEFPAGVLRPGIYSVGIACTLGPPASPSQLDKYWSARMDLGSDTSDPGKARIRFAVVSEGTASGGSSRSRVLVGGAGAVTLGSAYVLLRRRHSARALRRSATSVKESR